MAASTTWAREAEGRDQVVQGFTHSVRRVHVRVLQSEQS
jgi:hypothetical protein